MFDNRFDEVEHTVPTYWFLATACIAVITAVVLAFCHGRLMLDPELVQFGGPSARVYCAFDVAEFKRDVFTYLDRAVPEDGFTPDCVQVAERLTWKGNKYYEVYRDLYCVRRLQFPTCRFVSDYADVRARELNLAMQAAIERAVQEIPGASVPLKELLEWPPSKGGSE